MDTVKLIEVIETTLTRRGRGVESDPVRVITQYWSKDGQLLAERDPFGVESAKSVGHASVSGPRD